MSGPISPQVTSLFSRLAAARKPLSFCIIRHGNTLKPNPNDPDGDFQRILSDKGKQQCIDAGIAFQDKLRSTRLVVHSEALRCVDTGKRVLAAVPNLESKSVLEKGFFPVPGAYPGVGPRSSKDEALSTAVKRIEKSFDEIGYAPLSRYFAQEGDAIKEAFGTYSGRVLANALTLINRHSKHLEDAPGPSTVVMVCHAEYSQALALRMAEALGLGEGTGEQIEGITIGEVEMLQFTQTTFEHRRHSSVS